MLVLELENGSSVGAASSTPRLTTVGAAASASRRRRGPSPSEAQPDQRRGRREEEGPEVVGQEDEAERQRQHERLARPLRPSSLQRMAPAARQAGTMAA